METIRIFSTIVKVLLVEIAENAVCDKNYFLQNNFIDKPQLKSKNGLFQKYACIYKKQKLC